MRETDSNRAVEKTTYFDLPPDERIDDPIDDDPPHALEFHGSVSISDS